VWEADGQPSGIYFIAVRHDGVLNSTKVVLVR